MTQHRITQYRSEYRATHVHQPHQDASHSVRPLQAAVFGTVFFEVVLRHDTLPPMPGLTVPGWTLRLWPQARLGDATLEATPEHGQDVDELLQGLKAQGIQTLGPVRFRRS